MYAVDERDTEHLWEIIVSNLSGKMTRQFAGGNQLLLLTPA